VGQSLEAGSTQPLGAIIRLQISDGTGLPPVIPDLLGLTLDEASAILFDIGYRNLFSREQPVEDEDQIGRIVATGPGAGTPLDPLDPGHRIVLVIGVEAPEPEPEPEPDDRDATDDDAANQGRGGGGGGPPDEEDG
jgi:beta-lactam-binding protein with PASTA domain